MILELLLVSTIAPVAPGTSTAPRYNAVAAGISFSCALTSAGAVHCWGSNALGVLGVAGGASSAVPVAVAPEMVFRQLSAGHGHLCALSEPGQAFCWGDNRSEQLGSSASERCEYAPRCSRKPLPIDSQLRFRQIAAGSHHNCALAPDGRAWCWGANRFGQLGNGSQRPSKVPVAVAVDVAFERIFASGSSSCGLTADGRGYCWGSYAMAPVGGAPGTALRPILLPGSFIALEPGACGLAPSEEATCWYQATSTNYVQGVSSAAVRGVIPNKYRSVAVGTAARTCALTADGIAYCWEPGGYDQVLAGAGLEPIRVSDGLRFASLAKGFGHACGLTLEGALFCWGLNEKGELGNGAIGGKAATPVAVLPPR